MTPRSQDEIAGLQAYADSLKSTFETMVKEAPAIQENARRIQVTETSPDGLISVTVGARGELVRLDIDPRVYRRPDSRELADTIVETIHAASEKAKEQVIEMFEPIIPREKLELHLDGSAEDVMDDLENQIHGRQ